MKKEKCPICEKPMEFEQLCNKCKTNKTCNNCGSNKGYNNSSGDFQCDNCGHDEGSEE